MDRSDSPRDPSRMTRDELLRELARARENEVWLRQATELAGLGHVIWDAVADRCLFCSAEYARIHGVTVDQYFAMASTEQSAFNHPDDKETYREAIRRLRQGRGFELEYRVVRPSGEVRHVREIGRPMRANSGAVVREICTIQDITDAKRAEWRLRQAQKMAAVGQLTGGVAHDFNTLLAVIQGNADLLALDRAVDTQRIDAILRATRRGGELTRRLLAFSRRQPLRPRTIRLHGLLRDMAERLRTHVGAEIDVEIDIGDAIWPVLIDPHALSEAVLGLASNARDAMPDGGTFSIVGANVRLNDEFIARFPDAEPGDYVMLSLSDSGKGMEPSVRQRAFEPFFTTKPFGESQGLGLSMVYGFAKRSGGQVALRSAPGEGTTVNLLLPRADTADD